MSKNNYLDDVVVIRVILIALLLIYHSFAPYSSWPQIADEGNTVYEFLCQLSYSFMLPSFVFISGIVVGHQIRLKGNPTRKFVIKKFKRLMVPSIVFSIIYYLLFRGVPGSVLEFPYEILNGVGHMWFLPMLFWCFVILYILLTLLNDDRYIRWIVGISMIASVCAVIPLPLRLINAIYYFNFFYIGFLFGTKKIEKLKYVHGRGCLLGWIMFFMIYWMLRDYIAVKLDQYDNHITKKAIVLTIVNLLRLVYSWFGTLAVYFFANYMIKNRYINVGPRMRMVGSYCFGIYIFQQFILKFLYYESDFIYWFESDVVPWIALLITLIISFLLTFLSLKTKIGRLLLG